MSKPITTLYDGLLEKRQEINIVRRQWGLVIGIRATAKALKAALSAIPDDAIIIDEEEYRPRDTFPVNQIQNGTVYIFEVESRWDEV